ncbi:HXXEE domain-containing protein [Polynucleobacter sp. IMCC 30228]|uniref:HXXEE domain-containing protein n=1 Tax=Polynucleobacter sp. IMCC 30228 TaxID=2781011 RepID=UPI001F488162|nr:HXXEE domain-containing protein [Polynucleobacter sp. IMCC 30228]MCE7526359.1 HXXEE domain-containing protein [Polynucleobacter sp. IMCC 30228]
MMSRIYSNWVYGGLLAGLLMLLLMPLLTLGWPTELKLFYLTLPVYMLHQYEEWDDDRFRIFINNHLGHGKNLLTHKAGFVINIFGVWGVIAISLYLAFYVNQGYGLIATYLVLVNALVHILAGFVLRSYNPGLITAIVLFMPLGFYTIYRENAHSDDAFQYFGITIAILIHVSIIWHLLRRRKQLTKNFK